MSTEPLGLSVAFVAGLLSFLSPCVLPLVPSYASFLTGMSLEELTAGTRVGRSVLLHGGLFILGFSLVFIALGASASTLGWALRHYGVWLQRVGGVLIVLFGLVLLGVFRYPGVTRDWRVHLSSRPTGYVGSVGVGAAFGAGWTPCIGPILGGILTLAASQAGVREGILLLGTYSAGLAVPFLLASVGLSRFLTAFARLRRWLPWVNRASGAMLVVMGILLATGSFTTLAGVLVRLTPAFLLKRI